MCNYEKFCFLDIASNSSCLCCNSYFGCCNWTQSTPHYIILNYAVVHVQIFHMLVSCSFASCAVLVLWYIIFLREMRCLLIPRTARFDYIDETGKAFFLPILGQKDAAISQLIIMVPMRFVCTGCCILETLFLKTDQEDPLCYSNLYPALQKSNYPTGTHRLLFYEFTGEVATIITINALSRRPLNNKGR